MASKINLLVVIFLLISFSTISQYDITSSYGQINIVPDNSLIAQTTDCITSMMTSALIGVNSDCTSDLSNEDIDSTDKNEYKENESLSSDKNPLESNNNTYQSNNPFNLSKNNPFYNEFQTHNDTATSKSTSTYTTTTSTTTRDGVTDFQSNSFHIVDGNVVDGNNNAAVVNENFMSPPPENPSTYVESDPNNLNKPVSNTFTSHKSSDPSVNNNNNNNNYNIVTSTSIPASTTTISNTYPSNDNELSKSIEGKNKHSEEISACFDRAFRMDNYLSDAEIIQCAEDRDSFSQEGYENYIKNVNTKNNYNDGKTDNKHSEEISACFDRAFRMDNYLSDAEIIQCAEDRDSFK